MVLEACSPRGQCWWTARKSSPLHLPPPQRLQAEYHRGLALRSRSVLDSMAVPGRTRSTGGPRTQSNLMRAPALYIHGAGMEVR